MLIGGCPGPSAVWSEESCSKCCVVSYPVFTLSFPIVLVVLLCCEWSVDCLLWLCGVKTCRRCCSHIFCGASSWIFDLVGGVSISRCGCELCLAGVVFDVALRVGIIFLLNLVSPVQLSPSSLRCSSCLESCVGFSCSCSCSCPCLLMMAGRQSSSSPSGIGQPVLCGANTALRGRLCTLMA